VERSGHYDVPGYVLLGAGSLRSVEWTDVLELDLDAMHGRPFPMDWDRMLAEALAALGITPLQDGPKWLVFPSYG
jgi:hypothetical protein